MTPTNTDYNPHEPWPIEELCCSFHYPLESVAASEPETEQSDEGVDRG